jgi:HlyD family secretion protein
VTIQSAREPESQEEAAVRPAMSDFDMRPRGRRVGRTILWLAILALVCGAATLLYYRRSHALPNVTYETTPADRGTVVAKVTATGNLSALLTVQVGSQVSGRVQELFVDYNSPVKKNQTIAKLDPLLFEAAVEQAKALVLNAQSTIDKDKAQDINAKIAYERSQKLLDAKVIAQSDFDTAKANYDAADAQVAADQSNLESVNAALHQAQLNLSYTTIVSPIDGIVISRSVDVGQTVAASFQAPTLFVIANDLRHMQVDTNVGESDVGRLTAAMPATFTVDAYPGKPFTGKLRQIRNASQTVQNVVTYDAVIDVENPSLLLRPGMTADVTFVVEQKNDVVRLRNGALRFAPDPQLLAQIGASGPVTAAASTTMSSLPAAPEPGRKTVWLLRDGKPLRVPVSTGVTDGTWTELVQGDVQPGDALITDMTVRPRRGLF